jgi:DNA mismatch endonuclease, patch repair protein
METGSSDPTLSDGYPHPSSGAARQTMLANRRRDTRPEVELRSRLHRDGFRFRCDYPVVTPARRVRVDIAFPKRRLAVFIDGCFWHRCPEHGQIPKANRAYWEPKLARNVQRDREIDEALQDAGWTVLRFWEHTPSTKSAAVVAAWLASDDESVQRPR